MKLIILILLLILIFALCYIMYQETTIYQMNLPCGSTYRENLQNMDASFLSYGKGAQFSQQDGGTHDTAKYFYNKIMYEDDPDLSDSFVPGTYNYTYFRDNSDNVYDISGIERDIKYFNNVSHILADYYSKNMIVDEVSE